MANFSEVEKTAACQCSRLMHLNGGFSLLFYNDLPRLFVLGVLCVS